ncbi:MAG: discoidin domain-containing protein [Ignavibacteriales bacterium]|nr:discoidin domain-containing protein [Ignavibacteriales bacterium]
MKIFLISLMFYSFVYISSAQTTGIKTYCNPMDLNYQYNFEQKHLGISYRSGADPVIVLHKGEYYLFVTISGGWWHSKDLLHWNYVTPNQWPVEDMCAPAAISVNDTLFLLQSTYGHRPIYYLEDEKNGILKYYNPLLPDIPGIDNDRKEVGEYDGPWDPGLFYDEETNRWYNYFGSSNVFPVYGIELDKSKQLSYKGFPQKLIYLHPDQHGWERFGQDHRDTIKPFIEGAWMNKYNGKYYLQYGAPGTEYNVYANGVYVGDDPLGPFTYAPYNPVSYKAGGFVKGAGHGNTFKDVYGNYWNTGTPWLAVNWNFERRIAMFPAGFDADGQMYSNTRFGDLPHYLPTYKWQSKDELLAGWMLLSYKKPVFTSSEKDTFSVNKVVDENIRTYWIAKENKPGEWITIDLQNEYSVKAIQVNYTDYKSSIFKSDTSVYTQFKIYTSIDNKKWEKAIDLSNEKHDRPNAYVELNNPIQARYVKYEHIYVASENLAISDFRVFGNGNDATPTTPKNLTAVRDSDERNVFLKWDQVKNVTGYNIRWGIAKDKLYQTYQVFADRDPELEIRALNLGQDYYFAIESFNENGVSPLSETVYIK